MSMRVTDVDVNADVVDVLQTATKKNAKLTALYLRLVQSLC